MAVSLPNQCSWFTSTILITATVTASSSHESDVRDNQTPDLAQCLVLRLKLRNGLQRIHICIFYQNINKNFHIKMLYVL